MDRTTCTGCKHSTENGGGCSPYHEQNPCAKKELLPAGATGLLQEVWDAISWSEDAQEFVYSGGADLSARVLAALSSLV